MNKDDSCSARLLAKTARSRKLFSTEGRALSSRMIQLHTKKERPHSECKGLSQKGAFFDRKPDKTPIPYGNFWKINWRSSDILSKRLNRSSSKCDKSSKNVLRSNQVRRQSPSNQVTIENHSSNLKRQKNIGTYSLSKMLCSVKNNPENLKDQKLLESTNFSVRSLNRPTSAHSKNATKKIERSQMRRMNTELQLTNELMEKFKDRLSKALHVSQSSRISASQENEHGEDEVRISELCLSQKSLCKSQEGVSDTDQQPEHQKFKTDLMGPHRSAVVDAKEAERLNRSQKPILTSAMYKKNRTLLRFDRSHLYDPQAINHSCLHVRRIETVVNPIK